MKKTLLAAAVLVTLASSLHAQNPPPLVSFQGLLTDTLGVAVADSSYEMQLRIYEAPTGGSPVWVENRFGKDEVATKNGIYSILLGEVSTLDGVAFNRPLYLEVEVESEVTPPRVQLVGVPYALGLRLPYVGVDTVDINGVFRVSNRGTGSGVQVDSAGGDGIRVFKSGNPTATVASGGKNGVEVNGAEDHGFFIGMADGNGLRINETTRNAIHIVEAGNPLDTATPVFDFNGVVVEGAQGHGFYVGNAGADGLKVGRAVFSGVRVDNALWGARLTGSGIGAILSGGTADLELKGTDVDDNGRVRSDPARPSSDLLMTTNDDFAIHLDENGDETGAFIIVSDADTAVFQVTENGNVYVGGILAHSSDRRRKEDFVSVDNTEILDAVAALPIQRWRFKGEPIEHLGPTSQDFRAAFGLGENETSIATVDADGVSLAAIKGLYELLLEQQDRIAALEDELARVHGASQ